MNRIRHRLEGERNLRVRYTAPVRYSQIRGPFRVSIALESPIIEWGRDRERWCFLHDLDDRSLWRLMDEFRAVSEERRGAE